MTDLKVCVYLELEKFFEASGIGSAVQNQRKALRNNGVEVTSNPRDEYDILHLNTIGPFSFYYAKKTSLMNKNLVIHAHTTAEDFSGSYRFSSKLSGLLKKYLSYFYDQGDALLCPSMFTKDLLKNYNLDRDPIVISNGIHFDKFCCDPDLGESIRDRFDLDGLVIFSVGGVFKRKGIKTFLKVAEKFPDQNFVWFGPKYKRLQDREVKDILKNSPENLHFTGKIDNILGAYSAGDIFLFPSHNENQGIAALEAASCGLPMILRDIPGFSHFEDQKNCVKCNSFNEFVDAVDDLIEDADKRNKLGEEAQKIAKNHSLDKIGEKLIEIYRSIQR
ncbi:MAG: Glycosyltransferase, RfaG family [Candidatus Methanohalarchaeum thermophilum]|uniref:Glycosyltransferase, RfaG family n=1 Tax=Methanohalarchaeum thermophilum TaxID=1903181 RepID=A0A1Q6DXI0_METT1|nr:MAG: Glycosyltransferase, RfaG family [Candidatus Methanohalarchaeum thermophilum]